MKINLKIFSNPYFLFAFVWSVCLFFYSLGWADIYPKLSSEVKFFAVIGIALNLVFGLLYRVISRVVIQKMPTLFNVKKLVIANCILWLANFAYSGIPLVNAFLGRDFDRIDFGIPILNVFIVSYTAFLCLLSFYHYLVTSQRIYIIYMLLNLGFFILMFSRGHIMMAFFSSFFLWCAMQRRAISFLRVLGIGVCFLLLLFVFGIAGNYRINKELQNYTSVGKDNVFKSDVILGIANASAGFEKNIIPNEFMWSYIYLTSPLGNLQENINKAPIEYSTNNFLGYIVNMFTFDFISKRIGPLLSSNRKELFMFVPELSVPTVFAEPFLYLGWESMSFYLLAMLFFPFTYLYVMRNMPLRNIGLAVVCSIYFFSIFDNMFITSGLSLQFVYPMFFFAKRDLKRTEVSL